MERVCEVLCANEAELNDLDSCSGDANCGSTLTAGANGMYVEIVDTSLQYS